MQPLACLQLAMLLLVACDAGKKPTPPPAPTPTTAAPAQPLDASSADASSADAVAADPPPTRGPPAVKPPAHNGFLDAPAWPKDSGVLALGWEVASPSVPSKRDPQMLLAPLILTATIGTVTRRIELAPQFGALYPYNQPFCKTDAYPLEGHEVAKITFYEGGAGGYLVRQGPRDVLSIVAWEQSDGACPDTHGNPTACPRQETPVFRMHVPPLRAIHEVIDEQDERGNLHTLDCSH